MAKYVIRKSPHIICVVVIIASFLITSTKLSFTNLSKKRLFFHDAWVTSLANLLYNTKHVN